jgi:hypothetical protein
MADNAGADVPPGSCVFPSFLLVFTRWPEAKHDAEPVVQPVRIVRGVPAEGVYYKPTSKTSGLSLPFKPKERGPVDFNDVKACQLACVVRSGPNGTVEESYVAPGDTICLHNAAAPGSVVEATFLSVVKRRGHPYNLLVKYHGTDVIKEVPHSDFAHLPLATTEPDVEQAQQELQRWLADRAPSPGDESGSLSCVWSHQQHSTRHHDRSSSSGGATAHRTACP